MAVRIVPSGGRGIGVEADGSNYPFVDPSDDILGLLADLWLSHVAESSKIPFRVAWAYGFSRHFYDSPSEALPPGPFGPYTPTHDVDLVIVDDTGAVVFNSTLANYATEAFGARLRVHEWQTTDAVLRVVQHTAFSEPEDAVDFPAIIQPTNGVLDERTHELMPKKVNTIKVGSNVFNENIVFTNGFNTTFEKDVVIRGNRRVQRIFFNAAPGSGLGKYPACAEPDLTIRKINNVRPDEEGNFILAANDCYYARQPTTIVNNVAIPTASTMKIGSDCLVCCECDDFVRTYKGLKNVHSQFRSIASRAESTRDELSSVIDRFNAEAACRKYDPITIAALPTTGGYIDIAVAICNNTNECMDNVTVQTEIIVNNGCDAETPPPGTAIYKRKARLFTTEATSKRSWTNLQTELEECQGDNPVEINEQTQPPNSLTDYLFASNFLPIDGSPPVRAIDVGVKRWARWIGNPSHPWEYKIGILSGPPEVGGGGTLFRSDPQAGWPLVGDPNNLPINRESIYRPEDPLWGLGSLDGAAVADLIVVYQADILGGFKTCPAFLECIELTLYTGDPYTPPEPQADFELDACNTFVTDHRGLRPLSLLQLGNNIFTAEFDRIIPGVRGMVRFRIKVNCVNPDTAVVLRASALQNGSPLLVNGVPVEKTKIVTFRADC